MAKPIDSERKDKFLNLLGKFRLRSVAAMFALEHKELGKNQYVIQTYYHLQNGTTETRIGVINRVTEVLNATKVRKISSAEILEELGIFKPVATDEDTTGSLRASSRAAKPNDSDEDERQVSNQKMPIVDCSLEIERHTDFVGREWLRNILQRQIEDIGRGYILLTGGPGIGKSAFIANQIGCAENPVYHFIKRGMGNWDHPNCILESLEAQLRSKYRLGDKIGDEPRATFLATLQGVSRSLKETCLSEIKYIQDLAVAQSEIA